MFLSKGKAPESAFSLEDTLSGQKSVTLPHVNPTSQKKGDQNLASPQKQVKSRPHTAHYQSKIPPAAENDTPNNVCASSPATKQACSESASGYVLHYFFLARFYNAYTFGVHHEEATFGTSFCIYRLPLDLSPVCRDTFRKLRVREKTYDVNLVTATMPFYEPLMDGYLQDYFNSPSMRKHLVSLGIVCDVSIVLPGFAPDVADTLTQIDENGYITDDRKFKYTQLSKDRHDRDSLGERLSEQREIDREVEVGLA
jgi:hypothetical protein